MVLLQHNITVGATAEVDPSFMSVVDAILRLGCCNKARISIEPPDKVTVMVYGGQAAAEFSHHNQEMAQSTPNSSFKPPTRFIWGIRVQLRPGEGLSQLSQPPSLLLKCHLCKAGGSKVCNNAADAISFLKQHSNHDEAWAEALQQQHQLKQYLDQLFKQHQQQQKQHPENVLPIQRSAALICVEVAYLLLRTPQLRISKWLETLAQTILFHRVMWYMTSSFRPSLEQLQHEDPAQQQRSPHLLWLLVGAPPYCQSALAIDQDKKHWSLEASCLVALLHRSELLPRVNHNHQAPTEQQVLAALQQLVLRFQGASADAAAAAAITAPGSQQQQVIVDRPFIEGLLQLRGLQLQDIVRAAGPEGVGTQADLCAVCGADYEPPDEQLTECKICCHSYHISCATDPQLSGVYYTAAAVAAAKRGTCLGCQGFPLNAVSAAAAGGASSSGSPRKELPWGAAEASTVARVGKAAQASLPPPAAAVAAASKGHKATGSPSKGRKVAAAAAGGAGADGTAAAGGRLAAAGLQEVAAHAPSSSPGLRPPSRSPIAEAAVAGNRWPCQPTSAAAEAADFAQTAREYQQYTVSALSSRGISAQSLNAGALLHHALLPPGLQLDILAGVTQQVRARFTVVPAGRSKQNLQCSLCKTLFATLSAADEHAYGGKSSNRLSGNMRLVGTGGMTLRDFLQWIKDTKADQQQEHHTPEVSLGEATQGAAHALQLLATAGPAAAAVQARPLQQQAADAMPAPRRVTSSDGHMQEASPPTQFTGQSVAAILEGLGRQTSSRGPTAAADVGGIDGEAAELAASPSPTGSVVGGQGQRPPSAAAAGAAQGPAPALVGVAAAAEETNGVLPVCTLPTGLRVGMLQQQHQQHQQHELPDSPASAAAAAAVTARGQKRTRGRLLQQGTQQPQHHREQQQQQQPAQQLRQMLQPPQHDREQGHQQLQQQREQQQQQHEPQLQHDIQHAHQQRAQQQQHNEQQLLQDIHHFHQQRGQQQQQQQQEQQDIQQPEQQGEQQQRPHRDGSSDASVGTSTGPTGTAAPGNLTAGDDRPSKRHKANAPQQEQTGQQQAGQATESDGAGQSPAAQPSTSNTQSSNGLQQQQSSLPQQQSSRQQHRLRRRRASAPVSLSPAEQAALMRTVKLRWQLFRVPNTLMRLHLQQLLQLPDDLSQQPSCVAEQFINFWVPADEADGADGDAEAGSSSMAAAGTPPAAAATADAGDEWDWEGLLDKGVPRAVLQLMEMGTGSALRAQQLDGLLQSCFQAAKAAYCGQSAPAPGAVDSAAQQQQQQLRQGQQKSRALVTTMFQLACKLISCSSVRGFWKVGNAVLTAAAAFVTGICSGSGSSSRDQSLVDENFTVLLTLCLDLPRLSVLTEQTWHDIWRLIRRDAKALNSQSQQQQQEEEQESLGQQRGGSTASYSPGDWLHALANLLALLLKAPAAWQQLLGSTCGSHLQQQGTPQGSIAAAAAAELSAGHRNEKLLKVLFRVYRQLKQLEDVMRAKCRRPYADMQQSELMQVAAAMRERLASQQRLIPAFCSAMSAASACMAAEGQRQQQVQEGLQQQLMQRHSSVVQLLPAQLVLLMDFQVHALLLSEVQLGKVLAVSSAGAERSIVGHSTRLADQIRNTLESIRAGCGGTAQTAAQVLECSEKIGCTCRGHLIAANCEYLADSIELTLACLSERV